MYQVKMPDTDNRKIIEQKGNITIYEYEQDLSTNPGAAMQAYYSSKMNNRRRQVITSGTNVKGVGDLAKKFVSSKVTNESTIKPKYTGKGILMLEPTYKYLIIEDVASWNGMVIDDGLFLACDANTEIKTVSRKSFSSAIAGGEGLFNSCLIGNGFAVLECSCPREELVEVELQDDELKVDGNFAIAWSQSLKFTVERSTKTLIGSAASGEGLVNVYRGTGKVLMAPL